MLRCPVRLVMLCVLLLGAGSSGEAQDHLRVATYNLRNYLAMDRQVDGIFRRDYPKPEKEKTVIRAVIRSAAPDLLAVQEIGSEAMLLELREDLAMDGFEYSGYHVMEADDDTRRIGALWKEGLSVTVVPHLDLDFSLFGEPQRPKRGMLELQIDDGEGAKLSVFILHLKSKYTSDSRDPQSAERRIREAQASRDRILQRFPNPAESSFLVMGDLNDYRNSSAVRRFLSRGDTTIARIVEAKDPSGLLWTHFYDKQAEYSLIDYILASPGLEAGTSLASGIADEADAYLGSDHRLVWADLDPISP